MNKALSLAVFAGGVILLGFGIDAYNSASSDISRLFSGAATDKSIWMIAGGIAAIVFGIVGVLRSSKTS